MLLINCSNREKNCYSILNSIKKDNDKLISLSNKDMKFCLGCGGCHNNLENYCALDDFITNNIYNKIIEEENIVLASPMYMSNVNGILKNLLDRLNPLYQRNLLNGKKIYLLMTGGSSKEDNEEEINSIIKYFEGISEWMYFDFEFLDYFVCHNNPIEDINYESKINKIKETLKDKE